MLGGWGGDWDQFLCMMGTSCLLPLQRGGLLHDLWHRDCCRPSFPVEVLRSLWGKFQRLYKARAEGSLTLTSRSGHGATALVLNCRYLGPSKAPGKARTCSFSPCLPQFPHQEMGCCIGTPPTQPLRHFTMAGGATGVATPGEGHSTE